MYLLLFLDCKKMFIVLGNWDKSFMQAHNSKCIFFHTWSKAYLLINKITKTFNILLNNSWLIIQMGISRIGMAKILWKK